MVVFRDVHVHVSMVVFRDVHVIVHVSMMSVELSQSRFLRGYIAPFLHHRSLHLPWIGSGSSTDFLGYIHTFL